MIVSFKREVRANYMIIRTSEGEIGTWEKDSYEMKVINRSLIDGLIPFSWEKIDDEINFLYDISSRQIMNKVYETEKMGYDSIVLLLDAINELSIAFEEYLMELSHVLIDPAYIFIGTDRRAMSFCYCPVETANAKDQIRELSNYLLTVVDYSDPQAVSLVYDFNKKVQNDFYTMSEVGSRQEEARQDEEEIEIPEELPIPTLTEKKTRGGFIKRLGNFLRNQIAEPAEEEPETVKEAPAGETHMHGGPEVITLSEEDFEDDDYFEPTVLLTETETLRHRLEGRGATRGMSFEIEKYPFTIGKGQSADCSLDISTVSRLHARLYEAPDGEILIEDMNSTNGTFVNGNRLEAYTGEKLRPGNVIRIAREELVFR